MYNYNTLPHKGYGRIYVPAEEDIKKVEDIILQMDHYEYAYMPKGMVACIDEYPKVVYTHKFDDLDMDGLTILCWKMGIPIWVYHAGQDDFPEDKYKKYYIDDIAKRRCPYYSHGACIKKTTDCDMAKIQDMSIICTKEVTKQTK